MSDHIAISVQGVSKAYRMWNSPASRVLSPAWKAAGDLFAENSTLARELHAKATGHYRDFWALKNISFEVKKGESVGIIGRNGSGKSTLLQIIAGTLQPTTGSVKVNGRVAALLELGSGFNPEFTGRENVYLNGAVLGLSRSEVTARFDAIAAFADIGDFIDQPVKTYSSGMTMRLAFAVIAHVDADILIVDEALAVGDVFFVQKCMRFISDFQSRGTLLLVTHDSTTITALCQHALWLDQGSCRGIGSAKDIAEDYLRARYEELQPTTLTAKRKPAEVNTAMNDSVDQRLKFINNTSLRNDIKPFSFNTNANGFGAGGASIEDVRLVDSTTLKPLSYIVGGEDVTLRISAKAIVPLERPILGFYLKNHLGQMLFGDNTFLSYMDSHQVVDVGCHVTGLFHFRMPFLPAGDYMFSVACAAGTQQEHIQHQWLHDALALKSQSSHLVGGLIGLPMLSIKLSVEASTGVIPAWESQ